MTLLASQRSALHGADMAPGGASAASPRGNSGKEGSMFTKKLLYGAAYYPEHWDPKLWARDARLMRGAGFNLVRVGEFAWHNFEPSEGVFRFDWLDEAIATLDRQGIRTIIGTPTATIPAWMATRYPQVMAIHDLGHRRPFGIRSWSMALKRFRTMPDLTLRPAGRTRTVS